MGGRTITRKNNSNEAIGRVAADKASKLYSNGVKVYNLKEQKYCISMRNDPQELHQERIKTTTCRKSEEWRSLNNYNSNILHKQECIPRQQESLSCKESRSRVVG